MKLVSITLCNFRCFGPEPQTICLDALTAFVGDNGTGKSAVLNALRRLFGITQLDRQLERLDFHIPADMDPMEQEKQELSIEVRIAFPELAGVTDNEESGVSTCFRYMVVDEEGGVPYSRIRLSAVWSKGNLPEGTIEDQIQWITSADGDEEAVQPLRPHERSRIHVLYVPATRNPSDQLRAVSRGTLYSLLRAARWSDETKDAIKAASETIQTEFENTAAVTELHDKISARWSEMYDGQWYSEPRLQPVSSSLNDLLRRVAVAFRQPDTGSTIDEQCLSDGLRSLFYLALVTAAFDVERSLVERAGTEDTPFESDALSPPDLTLFAIEEPENHLAPHYLSRIIGILHRVAERSSGQVAIASHSASILRRVDPSSVRHFRIDQGKQCSMVRSIELPDDNAEAFKYVKEAVQAYPELYFSRFVILCEGDSEEVVLPRIAETLGVAVDEGFISIVPLGGRHVNHFWRLLNDLAIPHLTLLDLDRERHGGDWGRVKYGLTQLLECGEDAASVLACRLKGGGNGQLSRNSLKTFHQRKPDDTRLSIWIARLEEYGVFFSAPLDVDFLMLTHFQNAYMKLETDERGPRIPDLTKRPIAYAKRMKEAKVAVLGEQGGDGSTYDETERTLFPWYTYRFLGQGKPSTHLMALSRLTDQELLDNMPPVFQSLFQYVQDALNLEPDKA